MKLLWWIGWLPPLFFLLLAYYNDSLYRERLWAGEDYQGAFLGLTCSLILASLCVMVQVAIKPSKELP